MSTVELADYQYELGDVVFGTGTEVFVEGVSGIGTGDLRGRKFSLPAEDAQVFGRENRDAKPIVFEGRVVRPGDPAGAFDMSAILEGVFDGEECRLEARTVVPLRLRRPGADTRVVFGRPDDYDPDVRKSIIGLIPFTASFIPADPRWYSDTLEKVTLGLMPPSAGGLVTVAGGLPSPITTIAGTRRSTVIDNLGTTKTWPVITVTGPISEPGIGLADTDGGELWWLEFNGSIAAGQTVTFDTRPWSRGVFLGDGSPIGGRLSRRSRPKMSWVPPGQWELLVKGVDLTGTSHFQCAWRHAFKSI